MVRASLRNMAPGWRWTLWGAWALLSGMPALSRLWGGHRVDMPEILASAGTAILLGLLFLGYAFSTRSQGEWIVIVVFLLGLTFLFLPLFSGHG